ncbi:cyclopropane-fatty-acyl-phospholipid synthase family protein [Geobacter hydrogenophilus]|uniref:Cyclopropane-fatty-acyl-phospholipid synthase n=1 Tax=Geobacter hydrogenophilus TaxID=40983 RepID=A0A9W6LE80_9BACT|nr:cyclopropane-fatty-acyl-phospholipid synthase family protein [Geobacter hydrogenophilus]MBT0894440.1 cyclopropane-fatty-acyl-phospholipid synthase family protein [Geobacter hydrogenophilus]GLI39404.1 cyclopropane-fatty-acyl-phospholipid synthase [Geobacter hydrogenophilus]
MPGNHMVRERPRRAGEGTVAALSFLEKALAGYHPRDFEVRLWDGTLLEAEEKPRFTMVLNHPGALRGMFLNPSQITLGEAFIRKDFDIEGDLVAASALGDYLMGLHWGVLDRFRMGKDLFTLPAAAKPSGPDHASAHLSGSVHSKKRDSQAIAHHYNVSNDFYRLWLDERMVYSCAYFTSPCENLDAAQERKLDYICRKLRLKPGERLLDIGCGWGGLVLHAARNYGVEACGITLSSPQAELAGERIRAAGLGDRCRVEVKDYRELDGAGMYDKIVSVGMFEHVGKARLEEYFDRAFRLLGTGGVFLNHGIAAGQGYCSDDDNSFIERYVFPDGELLPIDVTLKAAAASGFEVRDLESLREHYALTLRHWINRLESAAEEAISIVGEATYRIWRLYMAGSAHAFDRNRINIYQAVLLKSRAGNSGQPFTRADWYT